MWQPMACGHVRKRAAAILASVAIDVSEVSSIAAVNKILKEP